MAVYREAGMSPFSAMAGCFPMLLQLPVFIGLYYALQGAIQLRQEPFVLWITDLSAPESLFTIPGLELPVRLLPLLMGGSMILQTKDDAHHDGPGPGADDADSHAYHVHVAFLPVRVWARTLLACQQRAGHPAATADQPKQPCGRKVREMRCMT